MSTIGIQALDTSVQKVNEWVKEFGDEIGEPDKQRAYRGLAAGLQALRDRLPVELSAHLAAQLPLIIKGVYYDGWRPATVPNITRKQSDYLESVAAHLTDDELAARTEDLARGVFAVLERHITPGEVEKVCNALPEPLRQLWPHAA